MTAVRSPTEGIYRRVSVRMYADARFMALSPLQPSGQALWLYLLTGPHTGPIPGVFVFGKAAMAEALSWETEAFEKAFGEVLAQSLVTFDAKTRLWFVPNAIRHNMPANPNVVKSWRGPWSLLPECQTRNVIADHLFTSLSALSESFGRAFIEAIGKALPKVPAKSTAKQETGSSDQDVVPKPRSGRARVTSAIDACFARVWAEYPRKVGKAAAMKAFGKLQLDPQLEQRIVDAIRAHRVLPEWTKESGQFVPHLSSWLNGRRWEDELPPKDSSAAAASADGTEWRTTQDGVRRKGIELGVGDWDQAAFDAGRGEQWTKYVRRVEAAAEANP